VAKVPKEKSQGEESFALHCKVDGLEPVREFRFHPVRKWKSDFAFPAQMLLVEIEGLGGRHQSMGGFIKDMEKYNAAALLGYRVLRYPTNKVLRGDAIEEVKQALRNGGSLDG